MKVIIALPKRVKTALRTHVLSLGGLAASHRTPPRSRTKHVWHPEATLALAWLRLLHACLYSAASGSTMPAVRRRRCVVVRLHCKAHSGSLLDVPFTHSRRCCYIKNGKARAQPRTHAIE